MRRAVLVVALAALMLAVPARAADPPPQVQLPLPWVPLGGEPPLTSDAVQAAELRIPRPMTSRERVRIGIDGAGTPISVEVEQRLDVRAGGDYTFIVPAPATDVLPGPGTESDPGFLRGAILWQGFSPGRRTLVAIAKLDPRRAVPPLPLRLSLRTTVGGVALRAGERRSGPLELVLVVANRTAASGVGYAGRAIPSQIAQVLDSTRRALLKRRTLPLGFVVVYERVVTRRYRVDAGFRLEAELVFPRGRILGGRASPGRLTSGGNRPRVAFAGAVGAGAPPELTLRVTGRAVGLAAPSLVLHATPVMDVPGLRPPRGDSWARALRRRLVEPDGKRLLALASETFLRLARTTQYQNYLQNPDAVNGPIASRAVYTYATTVVRARAVQPREDASGIGPLATAAIIVGSVLAAAGLVVVWAHL